MNLSNMVLIPKGKFIKGSNDPKTGPRDNWLPRDSMYFESFKISKYPVTNSDFKKFIEQTGYESDEKKYFLKHWKNNDIPQGMENHPVVYVNIFDAIAYCKWAGMRLPLSEEWEKAARGENGNVWPWGNIWDQNKCNNKDYNGSLKNKMIILDEYYNKGTLPVDVFPEGSSPYGIMDMAGNVWEWTMNEIWAFGNIHYIIRGGSFTESMNDCRCFVSNFVHESTCQSRIGFRCAMDV